ncbi:MAG: cytidine deaminase [Candidatus Sericytochromatia bacterium]|nr:cytidine deaminase [Candidatus Sericytochromatia bacterium]
MTFDPIALLAEADLGAQNAYCPYSRFQVGAALLAADGTVFRGCNVENVSYGLAICAERSAICAAVVAGSRDLRAIAIVQGVTPDHPAHREPCWPCGACRQVLAEFNPELLVVLRDLDGPRVLPLRDLLPHSFDVHRLQA